MSAMPEARRESVTWKEYAGRVDGPDGWQFGDVWRRVCVKISSMRAVQEPNPLAAREAAAAAQVEEEDVSILDLKSQRDQLVGQRKRMEKLVTKDAEYIKGFMEKGEKQKAMMALKRRKLHEQMVLDCENHVTTLDGLIVNIEVAKQQKEIVSALAEGVKQLKKVKEEIGGADAVAKLMDEQQDLTDEIQEINELLAGSGVGVDEDEILAELQKMEEAAAMDVLHQKVVPENAPPDAVATPLGAVSEAAPQAAAPAAAAPVAAAPVEEEETRQLIAA